MGLLAILALGLIGWAWFTGRLAGWTGKDAIAFAAFVGGASLAARGAFIPGAVLLVGGGYWIVTNRARLQMGTGPRADEKMLEEARELLGVLPWAKEREIRAAYRDRITTSHPDRGGSTADTVRLTQARDLLIREAAQRMRK